MSRLSILAKLHVPQSPPSKQHSSRLQPASHSPLANEAMLHVERHACPSGEARYCCTSAEPARPARARIRAC